MIDTTRDRSDVMAAVRALLPAPPDGQELMLRVAFVKRLKRAKGRKRPRPEYAPEDRLYLDPTAALTALLRDGSIVAMFNATEGFTGDTIELRLVAVAKNEPLP